MNLHTLFHLIVRLAFVGASVAIGLTLLEVLAQFFGMSIIGKMYSLGRLLELAVALLAFVIAALLREIRDDLRTNG